MVSQTDNSATIVQKRFSARRRNSEQKAKHLDHIRIDIQTYIEKYKRKFAILAMLIEYFLAHGPLIFTQKTQSLCQVLIKPVIQSIECPGCCEILRPRIRFRKVETLVSQRKSSLSLNRSRCIFQR